MTDTIAQAETAVKTDVSELEGHTRESAIAWLETKFQESFKAIHDFFDAADLQDEPAQADPEPIALPAEPTPVDTPAEPAA